MIPIIILLRLLAPGAPEALRSTAPTDLTVESAEANLGAALLAASEQRVDPAVLLSIAWHESRYRAGEITLEPGRKISCGVMTPEPRARCRPGSLLDGYRAGARHLRGWLDVARSMRGALLGYAGGFALARLCRRGPVMVREGVDACGTPGVFLRRAAQIRRALARAAIRW